MDAHCAFYRHVNVHVQTSVSLIVLSSLNVWLFKRGSGYGVEIKSFDAPLENY